jgi:pimeloyl-ACP methyl ester carboxylesterase
MNPGGPGGSGYLMPTTLVLKSSTDAQLNKRYDLIGFDPRGVGYSTSYDCPQTGGDSGPRPVGQLTEADLRQAYDAEATQAAACSSANPGFLSQLTTANVARDLNQIRQALHEKRMSYFGASWGTALGAVYRSMFPKTIGRMWWSRCPRRASPRSARRPGLACSKRSTGSRAPSASLLLQYSSDLARTPPMWPGQLVLDAGYGLGSDRGSPNDGRTLFSKRVIAQIRSPVRVRT